MTLRIQPILLSIVLLVMLNACGTSRPKDESSAQQDLPDRIGTDEGSQVDKIRQDSSDRSLAEVAELINDMHGYEPDLALEVLRSLESVHSSQLSAAIDNQLYGPELTGWLELALQVRKLLVNGSPVAAAAVEWADYHAGHVVTRDDFPALLARYRDLFPAPTQVAILLPTEGGLAGAARAIRDGIMSAYLEAPEGSVIRFYSSGENSASAIAAYRQAWEDGATQVIGPLRIESTRALASLENLGVPILLLNEPAGETPFHPGRPAIVNSLSLSRTEEAAAIANSALALGQKQAIVIVPDSAWGTRIETAFTTVFEQGEGLIAATARFNTATSDHSAMLTQLLRIDESRQRKTDLQSRLGMPLTFEPNRRDDFDFVFLAADPVAGRELKPLLRFHDVGDIPVYAMGWIYSGKLERASDQDLNGIVFPTTRWQLESRGETALTLESIRGGTLGDLYALGRDAWHLLPWLPLMQKDPDLWFQGSVGALRLQANGRLYRQPVWAQFSAGRPLSYQWPLTH